MTFYTCHRSHLFTLGILSLSLRSNRLRMFSTLCRTFTSPLSIFYHSLVATLKNSSVIISFPNVVILFLSNRCNLSAYFISSSPQENNGDRPLEQSFYNNRFHLHHFAKSFITQHDRPTLLPPSPPESTIFRLNSGIFSYSELVNSLLPGR